MLDMCEEAASTAEWSSPVLIAGPLSCVETARWARTGDGLHMVSYYSLFTKTDTSLFPSLFCCLNFFILRLVFGTA